MLLDINNYWYINIQSVPVSNARCRPVPNGKGQIRSGDDGPRPFRLITKSCDCCTSPVAAIGNFWRWACSPSSQEANSHSKRVPAILIIQFQRRRNKNERDGRERKENLLSALSDRRIRDLKIDFCRINSILNDYSLFWRKFPQGHN